MTDWQSTVPDDHEYATIRLIRVPISGGIDGITINHTLLGTTTHWDGRRTTACIGRDCPFCRDGHVGRWHAYVPLYSIRSGKIAVVQITQIAAKNLEADAARYGALRGLLLQLSRAQKRINARILIEVRPMPLPPGDLPEPLDVPRFMASIWDSQSNRTHADPTLNQEPE